MTAGRMTSAAGPIFLFACLTLGGSMQGIWTNLLLQLSGIVMIAWYLIAGGPIESRAAKRLLWIVIGALLLALAQLVPLPPSLWTSLPGREVVAEGFALLRTKAPWMPVSLAPGNTISALLACLPALAMLLWTLGRPNDSGRGIVAAVVGATLISVLVGMLQVTAGEAWYPYRFSSFGAATGLFANSNHMASLLLCSIPLLAAVAAEQWRPSGQERRPGHRIALIVALGTCAAALMVGIFLNGSFAVLLLGGPMLAASGLILLPTIGVKAGRVALLVVVAGLIAVAAIALIGFERLINLGGAASAAERWDILQASFRLVFAYAPFGSGLGTFPAVYALHEDPSLVTWTYVNHVHNDYLELLIELGIPGAVIMAGFFLWWGSRFANLWRSGGTQPIVRAATLVTLGLLLHSFVDFPLRTAGLSALFATALGLMAVPRIARTPGMLSQPRHLTLEDVTR